MKHPKKETNWNIIRNYNFIYSEFIQNCNTFFVGSKDLALFSALHDVYLQIILIVIAVFMLLLWINYAKK